MIQKSLLLLRVSGFDLCLTNSDDEEKLDEAKQRALKLTRKYPLPY